MNDLHLFSMLSTIVAGLVIALGTMSVSYTHLTLPTSDLV